jgi:nitroreductase
MTEIEHLAGAQLLGDGPAVPWGQVAAMVEIAARAPSVHNTQPWRFRVAGNALEIHADRTRRLAAVDPAGREMLISCGAAAYGLRLGARWLGYRSLLTLLPDPRQPGLLARLQLGTRAPVTARERDLLAAVPHRHTRRGPFTADPLPPGLLAGLQHDAVAEGAALVLIQGPGAYQRLAELVAAAGRWQRRDRLVRGELARWTRLPGSAARDGVPARAVPARAPRLRWTAAPGQLAPRDFSPGGAGQTVSGGAPPAATAILMTSGDTPADWLRAGQALHRLLLHAATRWVFASMNTEPLEAPALRALLSARLSLRGAPQAVLQFGTARTAPATPRRPVAEVLSWG